MSGSSAGDSAAGLTTGKAAAASQLWRKAVCAPRPLAAAGDHEAAQLLSKVFCSAGRPAEAADHLLIAISYNSNTAGDPWLLKQLGDCYLQAKQWQRALDAYQDALAIVREQQQQQQQQHQHQQQHESGQHQSCQQQSTTGNQTCSHNQQQVVDSQRSTEHQLQACCASAMYPQGGPHAEAAVHLVQTLLQHQLDVRQAHPLPEALRVYAQAAADKQQWAAAAKAAVQLVAHAPDDTEGVRLLVHAVQDPCGLQAVLEAAQGPAAITLPNGTSRSIDAYVEAASPPAAAAAAAAAAATAGDTASTSAAALLFLGKLLLDQGAVHQAEQLYRQAVQLLPQCGRCALGLAQALECQWQYTGVLQVLLGFCSTNPDRQLGPLALKDITKLPVLLKLSKVQYSPGTLAWWHRGAHVATSLSQHSNLQPAADCSSGTLSMQQQQQHLQIEGLSTQVERQKQGQLSSELHEKLCVADGSATPQQTLHLAAIPEVPVPAQSLQHDMPAVSVTGLAELALLHADDLCVLALLLTAAKVLFCAGALDACLALLQLSEPVEQAAAAAQPLHLSSIRNEAAYAGLMRKLLLQVPPAALYWAAADKGPDAGALEVLYVCGDSHVLPLAWRILSLQGRTHIMVPLLLTGCKVWHWRSGSRHPCVQQLAAAMSALPRGAKVLLVLGEIDCREGLLMAVEKMKYDTLEEAVTTTTKSYVATATRFAEEYHLNIWVHSVPPVLSETREVVQAFNNSLKQQLAAVCEPGAGSSCDGVGGSLHYLDLDQILLQHAECLKLDGTHLHPSYIQHLEAAMHCNT